MRKLLVLGLMLVSLPSLAADEYVLDSGHTYPNFTVDHMGFSLMHGRFNQTSGKLWMDRDGDDSRLEVEIQAASIDTGHEKRDEHLRGEDFFQVEKYPTLSYRSRDIEFLEDDTAIVNGELTLLGVTRPVPLEVDSIRCGSHMMTKVYTCGFNATGTLKRSEFGMDYGMGAIGDEITLRIEAEAFRQKSEKLNRGPRQR